jgi:hypothetical protein
MKKLMFFLVLSIFFITAMGQNSPIDKLFDKYSGKEGFTSVFISEYMFTLFSDFNPDDNELGKVTKGLKGIKILASDSTVRGTNFYKEIFKELPIKDYKELMVIKEKDQDIKFLVKEAKGKITELLMIVGGKDNLLICIQGEDINLKNISNLSKSMNIDGLEKLEKIDKDEK